MSDWQSIDNPPGAGVRVRVKHELGTYGFRSATGVLLDGKWVCSEAFIDPRTARLYWTPTHWAPLEAGQ